jgi:glutaminyl-tRNA synthetase
VVPDTKSGAHAASEGGGIAATVRLFDRLFTLPQPDAGDRDFKEALNPHSLSVVTAWLEPSLADASADARYQFERHGYFVTDRLDHTHAAPVFNRITGLKDSWAK